MRRSSRPGVAEHCTSQRREHVAVVVGVGQPDAGLAHAGEGLGGQGDEEVDDQQQDGGDDGGQARIRVSRSAVSSLIDTEVSHPQ